MKTKKTEKAPASKSKKVGGETNRARKMEPVKSKESKNQHFDSDEDEEPNPEIMEDDFKNFENFEEIDDDDDDY